MAFPLAYTAAALTGFGRGEFFMGGLRFDLLPCPPPALLGLLLVSVLQDASLFAYFTVHVLCLFAHHIGRSEEW